MECRTHAVPSPTYDRQNRSGSTRLEAQMDMKVFRRATSSFLTGVTIAMTEDSSGKPWGFTANSFSVVSQDPPLVSICVGRETRSFRAFQENNYLGISILSAEQRETAIRFAQSTADKFAGVKLREPTCQKEAPTLDGSAAWFECEIVERLVAGDHILLIGRVLETGASPTRPLGFIRGTFFEPAPTVDTPIDGERRVTAGWVVEHDNKIILKRDAHHGGRFGLPTSLMKQGSSTTESLARSAFDVFNAPVDISFLYSVIDDPDHQSTCFVYRGRMGNDFQETKQLKVFDVDALPWSDLAPHAVPVLKRYVAERPTQDYGIFLNIGARLASIRAEKVLNDSGTLGV